MKKERNYLFGLILATSVLANGLFLYSKFTSNTISKGDEESALIQLFSEKTSAELYAESFSINQIETILNNKGDSILLGSVCNPNELFLLISDVSCNPCVYYCLEDLNSFIHQIGIENVTVLGHYQNKREFFHLSDNYPFQFYLMANDSKLTEIASRSPLFYKVDETARIKSAFFPISQYRILTQNYLKVIGKGSI